MKRRNFLKSASALAGVPLLLRGVGVSPFGKSSLLRFLNPDSDRVLVLIQLNGGNDGLNMVLPMDQYDKLSVLRSNILLPESAVLSLTEELALHPVMTGVKSMYDDGRLTLLQNVGYPNQNRSHFRSTDIWTSASPADEYWNTGWLGRYLTENHPDFPEGYPNSEYPDPLAITMGSIVSQTCQGIAANYSLALNDPFSLSLISVGAEDEVPDTPYGWELTFLRQAIAQTNAYSDVIFQAAESGNNLATYPENNRLAEQLRNVALLISGGLQTKIYVVSLGGFDTHANQVDANDFTAGSHADLLRMLSDAMAAFQQDLAMLGVEERVVGMTFSEFGRQIASNNSLGTDHGTAAPLFVFGSCINPGIVGDNPQIPDPQDIEPQAGVPMQYDFRNVYGSILMDWFEVDEEVVKQLLYDEFQYLPILNPCTPTASAEPSMPDAIELKAFPNPFRSSTQIAFSCEASQYVRLSVFDLRGQELEVLINKTLSAGEHVYSYSPDGLPAGTYAVRLQLGNGQAATRLVNKL